MHFSCPACGKRYTFKPSLQGKEVTCKCGEAFTAALAREDPAAASGGAGSAAPRDDMLAKYVGFHRKSEYAAESGYGEDGSPFKAKILPIILLCTGAALWLGQITYLAGTSGRSAVALIGIVMLGAVVNAAVMLGGCIFCATLLNINFGTLKVTALKLLSIVVFTGAVGMLVAGLDPDEFSSNALILAWHVVIFLYFIEFHFLFELDMQENLLCVGVIGLMQAMVLCALWQV